MWKPRRETLSAYIRKRVLERSGYQEEIQIQKSLKELTYQFRKIGTNINQATKQLHIGYEPMAAVSRLQKNMNVLERQLEEMKEEFKQIYGTKSNLHNAIDFQCQHYRRQAGISEKLDSVAGRNATLRCLF